MKAKFTQRDGFQTTVDPFRPKPPHIKRRGAALHKIHDVLSTEFAPNEKIKHVHRTRGATLYTLYCAMHQETEAIRQLATVSWEDFGMKVTVTNIISEPCVKAEAQAELRVLAGSLAS